MGSLDPERVCTYGRTTRCPVLTWRVCCYQGEKGCVGIRSASIILKALRFLQWRRCYMHYGMLTFSVAVLCQESGQTRR
eukprot:3322466-Rhodomonas_salina.2